jgi:sugar transferase (PEP-CTERM/EpsH1 system associated)
MQELLFLAHRIPYPPNKGDKIRSYHMLRHLSRRYRVHLGTFVDDKQDWAYLGKVKELCEETCFVGLNPLTSKIRSIAGLVSNVPLSLPYYSSPEMRTWVSGLLDRRPIDDIVIFSSPMAQYVSDAREVHRVIDFVDVDSDKWKQYALSKRWPLSWLYRRESRLLLSYEQRIAREFDSATFVSEAEADLFRRLAPDSAAKTTYFNNGVDAEYFSPVQSCANPYPDDSPVLVFTGAMDYWANVDAVDWFARAVFPGVLARQPRTKFYIVGSRPGPQVLALGDLPGIRVTGSVPDVRPYVRHATLSVAPLRIARGIQNKVLEAMAMEKTVVASPQAMEGISATPGQELFVACDEAEYTTQIVSLIENSEADILRIGRAARARVLSAYGWDSSLTRLDALLKAASVCQPALTDAPDSAGRRKLAKDRAA